ncbi:hypothetical protein LWI29_024485 [Acer saccharum]|uniref:Alpha-farnesene synthase n=1 Tax=Acer saccharum TaxID=4024 RepID=A0AA39RV21_ACESA|nr:hypothetical protein LWI29_024485 [Acer saccharum]
MDGNGSFPTSKCRDIKGLIELFEASHVALEGENILEEAKGFSNGILRGAYSTLDGELAAKVAHILELPTHWRLDWFQVKWHLKLYERNKGINSTTTILCELAKLNLNMVQATHQNELKEVSRWWKNLGLVGKLNFARDRVVESFMIGLGLVSDPKQSSYRKWFAKAIALVIVIDDIYDVYGSLEELQHFTDAVDRWDSNEIQHLPEYMKIFFQALYDTINEIANEIQHEKGWNQVFPYFKKVWADHTKALLMEAKWYNEGYIPSLQEYLSIGWITSGCLVLGVISFFSIMNEVSNDMEHFLETNQQIMHDPCTIARLWNDLSTSKAEIERGDAPSAIQCYMREANVSEEMARNHITDLISKTLTKVNGLVLAPSAASMKPFVNVLANYPRVAYCFYQDGDGFGVQEDLKSKIVSVLIEPMDRVIESFLTGLGLVSDPKQSSYRKWFAKAIALVIVIDDIYDVYGSLEELQHFTNAVDRKERRPAAEEEEEIDWRFAEEIDQQQKRKSMQTAEKERETASSSGGPTAIDERATVSLSGEATVSLSGGEQVAGQEEEHKNRAEKLKEEVKLMFGKSMKVLVKLELIDILMKLGLSILFEKEITEALDSIAASIKINNHTLEEDLYATALCFRLLRLHGHEISQDIFRGFMDGNGSFSTSKCRDIKGLIELFEASHVVLEGENILEEAKGFSNGILRGAYSTLDGELAAKVAHILELPTHWRLDWFQVKWYLKLYERNKGINSTTTILCELAKLNFNMVQATHQNELKEVSRWWKNLGLVGKLNFARDRVVESFMTGLGLVSDPKQSSYRKWFAKAIAMVIVIDDIYDVLWLLGRTTTLH